MKKNVFLLFISFSAFTLYAQDTYLKWARQFAGDNQLKFGRGLDIETDAAGNVYSVGIFGGTVDFDPGPGVYNLTPTSTDVYISKLDSAGKFLWAKQITGSFGTLTRSFSLDKDNNIYITGTFQATVDFDPGPGVFNLTSNGGFDLFILKLTADGDFLWVRQLGGVTDDLSGNSSTTDSFGNLYFAGSFIGSVDFDPGPASFVLTAASAIAFDAFVCKLDAAGNFVWAGSIGGTQADRAFGISCDKMNDLYITGHFMGTADLDPGAAVYNLVSNGLDDMFILKLNAAGNFIWAKSVGGAGADFIYKAVPDHAGNLFATGYFRNTVDFDPGPAVFNLTAAGGDAIFVLKLDDGGNFIWAKGMGGPLFNNWGYDLAVDKIGNVYTTGFFIGPADFDPGPGSFILNSSGVDMFICKLAGNGNFMWAKSAGSTSLEQGLGITVDRHLDIYTTGQFGATVDFDLEASTYFLTAIPVSDPFVLKVAQCAAPVFTIIDTAICQGGSVYAGGANQTTTGIYRDTLLTVIGCDSVIITNLTVHPYPVPYLGPDRKICSNTQTVITPGTFNSYLWHDNSTQPNYIVTNAGSYWVKVTDDNNCSANDTLNILSLDTLPHHFLPADQELCYGNVLTIAVPGYENYTWSTGATTSSIDISQFGRYYLTVKDFNSCIGSDTMIITRKNCIYIGIPNSFTPNGNGLNDVFKPTIFQQVQRFTFMVFNRYGQKVFETTEYGKGWDGSFKGKFQPAGTYVYRITFTNIFGWETVENGTVLLIR
ncbi:MAG TPA: gliding motility-associated C-terminal domain-containing protein [Ferruginibacter sp.]|nr:gliding motility-associated C-terminal domain-containing protein [Ferruginibacter sp.]